MNPRNLASKLKKLRALRGMSQEFLAEESRVGLRTIQRIENKESEPTGETIKRLATALSVEINELVGANSNDETSDIKTTIILLKKQRSKTNKNAEIKTFEKFIEILNKLKEKDLSIEQVESIERYIIYLELEKIPSFSNEIFKQKLTKFKKFLKNKLRFVPPTYYTTWATSFALSFAIGFAVQSKIGSSIKIGVFSAALVLIGIGIVMDLRMKRQERAFSF